MTSCWSLGPDRIQKELLLAHWENLVLLFQNVWTLFQIGHLSTFTGHPIVHRTLCKPLGRQRWETSGPLSPGERKREQPSKAVRRVVQHRQGP